MANKEESVKEISQEDNSNNEWATSLRKIAIQQFVSAKLSPQTRSGRFGARYEKPLTGSKLNYALSDVLEVLTAFEGNIDVDADSAKKLREQLEAAGKKI